MEKFKKYYTYLVSFTIPALILSIIWKESNIFPFGEISNLKDDLSIQYIELYAYLQNVLRGEANLGYTFTKSLGGTSIALYAYYLASPINLLLPLFQKEDLPMFVYISSIIKLGLCGMFEAFYLQKRFSGLKSSEIILLSMCFALSYYNILQVENLMWMDGVYMLPIIMYGVWKQIQEKKGYVLIFSVAASIIFNWYTAYMNCLFAILYFIFESSKSGKSSWKEYFSESLHFGLQMMLGVLLSSALFLPNIYQLLQGKGGVKEDIWKWKINGNIFNILRGSVLGNDFASNHLSLFCGTIVLLLATVALLNLYKEEKKKFIASIVFLVIMILSLLVKPIENIWNGFRIAASDFYRFSYLQTWLLVYFSAVGFIKGISDTKSILKVVLCYIGIWSLCDYILPFDSKMIYCSFAFIGLLYIASLWRKSSSYQIKNLSTFLIGIVTVLELIINGVVVSKSIYTWGNYNTYENYVPVQKKLIDTIKKSEISKFYRIEQTLNRGREKNKCSAYFLENMGYNYPGFSHYSSTFNERVRDLAQSLGYGENSTVSMYDEPILTSDSFLGIKYIMSDIPYPQLILNSDLELNGKKIYENPYALPLGFVVSEDSLETIYSENHFDFQNKLFSNLIGQQVELYKPASTQMIACDNNRIIFEVEASEGMILYGYADSDMKELALFIDDQYRCDYERWLSYKIFNISEIPGKHLVRFENFRGNENQISPQFYQLDLSVFQNVINSLKRQSINITDFQDGHVESTIEMENDGFVLMTVPMEKGWKVMVNREYVKPFMGINTFLTIPVKKGENVIIMDYKIPYLKLGIMMSLGTLIFIAVQEYFVIRKTESKKFNRFFQRSFH